MKLMKYVLIYISLFGATTSLNAAPNLPYDAEGMVYDLQLENGMINVGDIMYLIPENVRVNLPGGQTTTGIQNISTNTAIGYTLQGEVISEIWVLNRAPVDHSVNDD